MNKETLNKFKKILENEKASIEKSLSAFATKDTELEGDWDTKFPEFRNNDPNVNLEEEADEVEEYISRLPVEHALETRLKEINKALERIKKGTYGICTNCNEKIPLKRLEAYPGAGYCLKCQNQK